MNVSLAGLSLLPTSARRPARIAAVCRKALGERPRRKALKPRGEVNVIFVSRARMRSINKSYLNRGHDTDVIAFNYQASPGRRPDDPFGDIYVSSYMARRQARELGHPVLTEVLTLAAHGALHLLGYDDATARERARMFRVQDRLVARSSGTRPDPPPRA